MPSKLWCWRRLLRVPWTARISNQSFLKEINPKYSSEGLMLNLRLQDSGHLMQRANSLEKTLMLGKIDDKRRRGQQRMRWLDSISNSMDISLSRLQETLNGREACCTAVSNIYKELDTTQRLNNNNDMCQINLKLEAIPPAMTSAVQVCKVNLGYRIDLTVSQVRAEATQSANNKRPYRFSSYTH